MRTTTLYLPRLFTLASALYSSACRSEHPPAQAAIQDTALSVSRPFVFRAVPDSLPTEPSLDTAVQLVVAGERIGPIPVDSSMGYIARLLPSHTVDLSYLETTPIIGWDFNIRGFSVWASQQASEMNPDLPASSWIIRGSGTVLLGDSVPLRFPTFWRELRKRLSGRAEIESGELGTRARFCALSRLAFPLDVGFDGVASDSLSPGSVPPKTLISAIEVWYDEDGCVE